MALSTKQVGAAAASGVAAATVRVGSGGRNVASTSRDDVERLDFAHQSTLNDETILRFQQDGQLDPDGQRQRDRRNNGSTGWSSSLIGSIGVSATEERNGGSGSTPLFLDQILRGIDSYEQNIRITSPTTAKPGSVMNALF